MKGRKASSREAQVALTLRTVCGLSTAEIARAFLVSEPAIIQRLTRARRKIAAAGIPYRVPAADELGQVLGPRTALDATDALAADLDRYHLYHATRAELLRELGRPAEARLADERALGLTGNPAERALLEQRLA